MLSSGWYSMQDFHKSWQSYTPVNRGTICVKVYSFRLLPIKGNNCSLIPESFLKKNANLPLTPSSCRSRKIPYFQVVSYAFSKSKNTATTCSFLTKTSRIRVSSLTKLSLELHSERKSDWTGDIRLLISKYQTSLALIILSRVLQRQLVSAIGQ